MFEEPGSEGGNRTCSYSSHFIWGVRSVSCTRHGLDGRVPPLCAPPGLTVCSWKTCYLRLSPLISKKWEIDREKGRKARLALEVDSELKTPRVHWGLGRPGTCRAQGRAGAHDLPALSALWPSLQERGRFGNTEAPGGRTLLLSGRSCLVTMPGRTQDKVLPQVCTWGLRKPQSELQQLQGQARCLGSFLGARILDSDVTASSGGRGGGGVPSGPLLTESREEGLTGGLS